MVRNLLKEIKSVLVVDDSKVICRLIQNYLNALGIRIITVSNTKEASRLLSRHKIDLVTVDINMPGESGIEWIHRESFPSSRLVVISDHIEPEKFRNLENKVDALIDKKEIGRGGDHFRKVLNMALGQDDGLVLLQSEGQSLKRFRRSSRHPFELLILGASTGGERALRYLLRSLPPNTPPVICVQHTAAHAMKTTAQKISEDSGLFLGNCSSGTVLSPGTLYMSDKDLHIGAGKVDNDLIIKTSKQEPINGFRPSIDFLFASAAKAQIRSVAILLTGVGRDGISGLMALKNSNSLSIAQDEASATVYGMPRRAREENAVQFVGDLSEIRDLIILQIAGKLQSLPPQYR